MVTTAPTPTYPSAQEMASLCKDLQDLTNCCDVVNTHRENGGANLTAEYERRNRVASQLSRGMFIYETDEPRPEFTFLRFLDPTTRNDYFNMLFDRIGRIRSRTEGVRLCFNQTNKTFDLARFESLLKDSKIETLEFAFIVAQVKEYTQQLKDIINIIMAQFD